MWLLEKDEILSLEQFPEGAYGFIYRIHNITKDKYYVGKKVLHFERKVPLGKKELAALENKRAKKWKLVIKESDWLSYCGSCKPLLEDIANGDEIKKEILQVVFSKRELTYREENILHKLDVLEREDYYNDNIASRYFRGNIK